MSCKKVWQQERCGQGEEHSLRDEEESETTRFAVAVLFQSMCPAQPMSGPVHSAELPGTGQALPWVSSQMQKAGQKRDMQRDTARD